MIQYRVSKRKQYTKLEVGMNIEPGEQKQSISDDQELAKVLAGINSDTAGKASEAPDVAVPTPPTPPPAAPADDAAAAASEPADEPVATPAPAAPAGDESLEGIKQQALGELRPLVDKLNVEADEKFDIYLLLLRSTDDKELIAPAHEAAKAIADESKRAQALLDVIKEIDFLNQGGNTPQPNLPPVS